MQSIKTSSRSSSIHVLVACALLLLDCGVARAQTTTQEECKANECFSPAFDVGVLVPSPVGRYGITELMYAVEMDDLEQGKDFAGRRRGGERPK